MERLTEEEDVNVSKVRQLNSLASAVITNDAIARGTTRTPENKQLKQQAHSL